jgi:glycosyltransferase involved in cell wall biosynthesis
MPSPFRPFIDRHLDPLRKQLADLTDEVDALRSRLDLGTEAFDAFQAARRSAEYQVAFDVEKPLVSVCIATYNRADLLAGRCLRSLCNQTWDNLEMIVVGDGCTDHTEEAVAALKDPRIRFVNRPQRSAYPEHPHLCWMVGGAEPFNQALDMAHGHFITHLDDDDEHVPHRVEALLRLIRAERADVLWHPFDYETSSGKWKREEARSFRRGQATTSSVFYHAWFKRIPWDSLAYQYREPADWNRFRKFRFLAARTARHPDSLLRHYREKNNDGYHPPATTDTP